MAAMTCWALLRTWPKHDAHPHPSDGPEPQAEPIERALNRLHGSWHASSSEWRGDVDDQQFTTAKAFDGDLETRWSSAEGDAAGAWLAVRWEAPVTVRRLVVREAFDRITDFVIQRYDPAREMWIDLMHVFANRHLNSYSPNGERTGWGYYPDAVHVDGIPLLENQDQRVFGANHEGNVHPVFSIKLPDPLIATGVRLKITGAKAGAVSLFEFEVY